MKGDHTPRHIIITGVSRGLGRALLEVYSRQGHQVSGCGRSATAMQELQKHFPQLSLDVVDVGDATAVQDWAADIVAQHGAPNLLINNASLINQPAPLWQIPATEFAQVMHVNVLGAVHTLQAFIPAMQKAGRGVIVNVSSSWGRQAEGQLSAYCASKFAVEGLTQALAQELPPGLAAVAVDPGGGINTGMLQAGLGDAAGDYPRPELWAEKAAPWLLRLQATDNGRAMTVE